MTGLYKSPMVFQIRILFFPFSICNCQCLLHAVIIYHILFIIVVFNIVTFVILCQCLSCICLYLSIQGPPWK